MVRSKIRIPGIDMTEFTPFASLFGGMLIGLSAVVLMALNGKIAGATGIFSGLLPPVASDWLWRAVFVVAAIAAPVILVFLTGRVVAVNPTVSTLGLVIGGLLVGLGVSLSNGCPSGHGICGIARLSPRSIVATVVFMITTAITVYIIRHLLGGF